MCPDPRGDISRKTHAIGRCLYLAKLRPKPMKMERKVFHRRDAEHAEMIHLFSLPLRRRQRKMLMPFPPACKPAGLEAGQGLIDSNNLGEAGGET